MLIDDNDITKQNIFQWFSIWSIFYSAHISLKWIDELINYIYNYIGYRLLLKDKSFVGRVNEKERLAELKRCIFQGVKTKLTNISKRSCFLRFYTSIELDEDSDGT